MYLSCILIDIFPIFVQYVECQLMFLPYENYNISHTKKKKLLFVQY